jgi:hypothetical protein
MSNLSPEAIEARRQYYREYGAKNREKRKEANAKYWQKYAARKKAQEGGNPNDTGTDRGNA